MKKEKKKTTRGWWLLGAILCGIVAAVASIAYVITVNMAQVLIILPAIGGTAGCLYKMMGPGKAQFEGMSEIGPVTGGVNAFCIYGKIVDGIRLAEKVEFVEIKEKEKLLGDRWYFDDLNQWLYVMFNDLSNDGKMTAFELPDAAYTDPARLAVQLNMGRVNELFQIDPSLFDQLKPWVLFATVSIVGFLIFLSGS